MKNTEEKFLEISMGNNYLGMTLKAQARNMK
jgi:hypothetical protein